MKQDLGLGIILLAHNTAQWGARVKTLLKEEYYLLGYNAV
jgi:hypothetical protein